jgi:hypothetical protein
MLSLSLAALLPETMDNLRRRGIRVACFFPDNPFPPHHGSRPETLPVAREADLCLIWSERLVEKLRAAGVRNPAFLPFEWDPQVFPYQGGALRTRVPGRASSSLAIGTGNAKLSSKSCRPMCL